MNKIAHIFSWILSPVLIPTYAVFVALWVTLLSFLPVDARWGVVAMTWVITCAIPVVAILLLYKFKVISAPGLNQQKERYIPYVVTALCYLGCGLYMYCAHVACNVHGGRCCSRVCVMLHKHLVENQCSRSRHGRIACIDVPHPCRRIERNRHLASYIDYDTAHRHTGLGENSA